MALAPNVQAAYGKLWTFVQGAAAATTPEGKYAYESPDVISAASAIYREAGQALSFAENSAIPTLFSMARSQARAISALNSAAPGAAIDASMISQWPTAASLGTQAAQPEYMAKAQFTYTSAAGTEETAWITLTGLTQLPASPDALALRLTGAAINAYTTPEQEGGNYLDAELMASFGSITQLQLYTV